VLVCDDDADIGAALTIYLTQAGYRVLTARDGLEALQVTARETVHLVLLDVMMPRLDGIQTAVRLRETSHVPILFLSAKAEDTDRILGLTMGGDDYITKPFNPVELLARVKAALRRYTRFSGLAETTGSADGTTLQTGGLALDTESKRVTVDGDEVQLTALEYAILELLMRNLDALLTSAQIYEAVWDRPAFDVAKTVSVHVRHIREKIEADPKNPRYLKVVYGLGYKVGRRK
jgi:DNA-binding response OmpR family regulator